MQTITEEIKQGNGTGAKHNYPCITQELFDKKMNQIKHYYSKENGWDIVIATKSKKVYKKDNIEAIITIS